MGKKKTKASEEYDGEWQEVAEGGKVGGKKKKSGKPKVPAAATDPTALRKAGVLGAPIDPQPTIYQKAEETVERKKKNRKEAQARAAAQTARVFDEVDDVEAHPSMAKLNSKRSRQPRKKGGKGKSSGKDGPSAKSVAKALDVDKVKHKWEQAKESFPKKKVEWLKAAASDLSDQLRGSPPPADEALDAPLCYLEESVVAQLVKLFAVVDRDILAPFFAQCIKSLVDVQSERDQLGLKLCIQLLVKLNAKTNFVIPSLRPVFQQYSTLFPDQKVVLHVMWAYAQVARESPATYLFTWKRINLDLLRDPNASAVVKDYAVHLLPHVFKLDSPKANVTVIKSIASDPLLPASSKPHPPGEYLRIVQVALSKKSAVSESQRAVLKKSLPYFRALTQMTSGVAGTFASVLKHLREKALREPPVLAHCLLTLNACLAQDAKSYDALLDLYKTDKIARADCVNTLVYMHKSWKSPPKHPKKLLATVDGMKKFNQTWEAKTEDEIALKKLSNEVCSVLQDDVQGSGPLWPLWLMLAVCTILFVVLSSHLVCHVLKTGGNLQPACDAVASTKLFDTLDRGYAKMEPFTEAYLRPAYNWLRSQAIVGWAAAGPHVTTAWQAVSQHLGTFWASTAQYRAVASEQVGQAWAAAAPHVSAALQAASTHLATFWAATGPYRSLAYTYLEQAWVAAGPYLSSLSQEASKHLATGWAATEPYRGVAQEYLGQAWAAAESAITDALASLRSN